MRFDYRLGGGDGYVVLAQSLPAPRKTTDPTAFRFRAQSRGQLEIMFVDSDGSLAGIRIFDISPLASWTTLVARASDAEYRWGGPDCQIAEVAAFRVAISTRGEGTVWFDFQGPVDPAKPGSAFAGGPFRDRDCDKPGFGFAHRRDRVLQPEEPTVLEWMKYLQDTGSLAATHCRAL